MILQRLATSIRKQDWFTVLIETLIVVLGVFLGLQVNNWNQARDDRQTEKIMLVRLASDFEQIVETQAQYLARVESARAGAETLLQRAAAGDLPEETADLCDLMAPARAFRPAPAQSATYAQLVANGDMRLIGDEDLRRTLAEFESQRDEHGVGFTMWMNTSLTLSRPFWSAVDICDVSLLAPDDRFAVRLREIVDSPEFAGAVSGLHQQHLNAASAHKETFEKASSTLALLREATP
jgi:hypothetical protein